MHPDDGCFDASGFTWRSGDGGDHVAATEVDFVFKGEDDGLRSAGVGEVAVEGGDGADAGSAAAWKREHFVYRDGLSRR